MTESVSLWQDMQSDRFYLLNNTTGYKTKVNSNTDYVKEFDSILTGQVGYKQRVEYAIQKNKPGYMPLKIEGLKPLKSTLFYTPQNDKFEGYSQFPQPRTQPYFNQKRYSISYHYPKEIYNPTPISVQRFHIKKRVFIPTQVKMSLSTNMMDSRRIILGFLISPTP